MDYKKISIIAFILTCLAQLYIPGKMILDREAVLNSGTEYKFRTEPVDPNDPFRGKYITLRFRDNSITVDSDENWHKKRSVYVQFENGLEGFAKIKEVSVTEPDHENYLFTTIDHVIYKKNDQEIDLRIYFPFDRYYMEEYKAPQAEETYMEANRDTSSITYALVNIKDGGAVLKDVIINDKSIKDMVDGKQTD